MDRDFEACDLIEVMDRAVRYNRFLSDSVEAWTGSTGRVLDFGAGNGRFCTALRERGLATEALEPDATLRGAIAARGIPVHGSLDAIPDGAFDAIYTINVLEHIEDDASAVAGLHRCLRPGGRLFVYVPAFPELFTANDERVGHVRRYRRGELAGRVRDAGFSIDAIRYVDSIGVPATLAYKWFGARDGDLDARAVTFYDGVVFPVSRMLDRVCQRWFGRNLLLRATKAPARGG